MKTIFNKPFIYKTSEQPGMSWEKCMLFKLYVFSFPYSVSLRASQRHLWITISIQCTTTEQQKKEGSKTDNSDSRLGWNEQFLTKLVFATELYSTYQYMQIKNE